MDSGLMPTLGIFHRYFTIHCYRFMWVYVTMDFTNCRGLRRKLREVFVKELVKDGFSKLYTTMYVRYCSTLSNALKHKKRIMEKIPTVGRISIILVADQQSEWAYHCVGSIRNGKKEKRLPDKPSLIEFF